MRELTDDDVYKAILCRGYDVKPCPFCGSKKIGVPADFNINCKDCGGMMPGLLEGRGSIERWNKRHHEE